MSPAFKPLLCRLQAVSQKTTLTLSTNTIQGSTSYMCVCVCVAFYSIHCKDYFPKTFMDWLFLMERHTMCMQACVCVCVHVHLNIKKTFSISNQATAYNQWSCQHLSNSIMSNSHHANSFWYLSYSPWTHQMLLEDLTEKNTKQRGFLFSAPSSLLAC